MEACGWRDVPLVGVETEGCECFAMSLQQGKPVKLTGIDTIATSLGCRECAPELLEMAKTRPVLSRVVTDKQAMEACLKWDFSSSPVLAVNLGRQ